MKKLIPILLITLSIGLQSCNSTVKSVYRDDFRSASKAEIDKIHKEVNAKNAIGSPALPVTPPTVPISGSFTS